MIKRLISILCLCAAGAANADVQTHCGGKYIEAAKLTDSAFQNYGTLYAGGNHFSSLSTELLKTIEVYRFMEGLPRLKFEAAPKDYEGEYDNYKRFARSEDRPVAPRLRKALGLMTAVDPGMHSGEIRDSVLTLDFLTSRGPADDWWLRPADFEVSKAYARQNIYLKKDKSNIITPAELVIAHEAAAQPALDWLLSALIISTQRHPWSIEDGTLPYHDMAKLLSHIEVKAAQGEGVNAWMSLMALHRYYQRALPSRAQAKMTSAMSNIENCGATPEDYAAYVSGDLPFMDSARSYQNLQRFLLGEARRLTVNNKREPAFDRQYYAEISALKDRAPRQALFALPLILSSPSLGDIKLDTELNPAVTRPLSVLSSEDLETLSSGAAFTRHLALGRIDDAERVLGSQTTALPELGKIIAEIQTSNIPAHIWMSIVALRLPCLSHSISEFCDPAAFKSHQHRDIRSHHESGTFIQHELSEWLYPIATPYRYNGYQRYYRQYAGYGSFPETRRTFERLRDRSGPGENPARQSRSHDGFVPQVFPAQSHSETAFTGLAALADWDEFKTITGEKRLTRVLSLNIIEWAVQNPPSGLDDERARDLIAEALHRVVRLNKHENGGDYAGKPVGQKAFELLHLGFPDSPWAKKTPYWYAIHRPH